MNIKECKRYLSVLVYSIITAAVLAGCSNPEQTKVEHVRRGETLLKEKKFEEASIEFRNAIQIDDKLAAAHWGLAQAHEGAQRFLEAVEELKRTIQVDPNNLDARVKLGTYYLAGRRPDNAELLTEAERLAKEVLEKDPNHIEGHILMASVLNAQGKRNEALTELNRAIQINPNRVESQLGLARFYLQTNELGKAEETYRRAIAMNDQSAIAHVEYGKFLASRNQMEAAEAQFRRAVEVEPSNRDIQLLLASFYLANKQLDKAEASFKAYAEIDRNRPEGRATLADFYANVGRYDEAVSIYQDLTTKSPDYTRARYRLGEIMLQRGDPQGATGQVDEVLRKNQRDTQALLLRSRIRLQNSDVKGAIEDLQEVLKLEPNSLPGLYFMAEANMRAGRIDQARSYVVDLERFYPNYLPAKLMQAQISLKTNDPKTALRLTTELLERLGKTTPDGQSTPQLLSELRPTTLIARGTAHLQMKNLAAARQDMEAARNAAPNSPLIYTNLATVALAENKLDEAAGHYERVLSMDATNAEAIGGLIKVYANQNRLDQAHARVDQALAAAQPNKQGAPLHYLKAQVYGAQKNVQAAEGELRRALELDPEYMAAYFALGAMYVNTNQQDRAVAQYREVVNKKPDNVAAHTLIGMLEDGRRNHDAAVESYRKALAVDANAPIAGNNLAWIYAEHGKGNLDEAIRLAQGIVQRFPDVAGFSDTLGWVYHKKGLHAAAIEQLQKAVAKENNSPTYRYHLGVALAAKGDKVGARREIEQALRLGEGKGFAQVDEAKNMLALL